MINSSELNNAIIEYYMPYAMKTITDRALPDVRDGLKPIHRRILWTMWNTGLKYNVPRDKCGKIVGDILKIHNHGDSSVYGALALLTEQNESLLHAFIDGEGAFGKIYSKDSPSAMRYTFARLNKLSEEMFKDIDKNIIKFIGEDKHHLQPLVLTNTFPNILIKPNNGMAVGEACNWCSFNLSELIDLTTAYINNKDIEVSDYLKAPDFSTGSYIIASQSELDKIYKTGRGKFTLRSKYRYNKEDNIIEVYEIPYNTTIDSIIASINDLITKGKINGISDVRDDTGFDKKFKKEVMGIAIELKRGVDVEKTMARLYKSTPLQTSFSCNFNCLVDYKPKVLGVKTILNEWLKFRVECITKAISYDITDKSNHLHYLRGLEKVLLDIDKCIEIIRKSEEDMIINNLINHFKIDDIQANSIANMKLRNINKNYIIKQIQDIQKLEDEINDLKETLNNPTKINQIIISQLEDVKKKYGQPRKTEVIYEDTIQEVSNTSLIEDYSTYCILTKEGYLKKLLRKSDNIKLKDGDEILNQMSSSNKSTLLIWTNKGTCYKIYQHEISECRPSQDLGIFLPQHLNLGKDEKVIAMVSTRKYQGYVIMAYESGKIAKIDLSSFKTKTLRSKLENALSQESPLINLFAIEKDTQLILKSSIDKVLIINTEDINSKASKNSSGNMILKSKNNSTMVMCELLDNIEGIEDISYYTGKPNSVGCYLKKTDSINIK